MKIRQKRKHETAIDSPDLFHVAEERVMACADVDFKKMYEQCEDENIRLIQLIGHLRQENDRLRAYPSFVNGERIAELEEWQKKVIAQAEDANEYVLAHINRELKERITELEGAAQDCLTEYDKLITRDQNDLFGKLDRLRRGVNREGT